MKKTILTLIIGILIGAIITTGVFLIIDKNKTDDTPEGKGEMMQGGERPNGEDGDFDPSSKRNFKTGDEDNNEDSSTNNSSTSNSVSE